MPAFVYIIDWFVNLLLCQCAGLAAVCLTLVLFWGCSALFWGYYRTVDRLKIVDASKKQRIYLKSAPHYILKLIITQLEFKLGLLEIYW